MEAQVNKINLPFLPFIRLMSETAQSATTPKGNLAQTQPTPMDKAWKDFLKHQPKQDNTATSVQALKQDAGETDAAEKAQKKIKEIMGNYDPEDGDADEKAEKIARDPELCKYLTKNQRAELVKGLFDGDTGEAEEDAAMQILRT